MVAPGQDTFDYPSLKVLTINNHKGGVGKTSLSKIITEFFLRRGKRVLGVDIDPQCNFSARFIKMENNGAPPVHPNFDPDDPDWDELPYPPPGYWSISEFFKIGYVEPYETQYENLKFIPSHKTELQEFLDQVEKINREEEVINLMRTIFLDEYYQEEIDVVVIDTPPQASSLTASAVRAATHLLIPTEMQEDSIAGMADMAQLWESENRKRIGQRLNLVGVLPTKYDKTSAAQRNTFEDLKDENSYFHDKLIQPAMRYLQTYANSSATYANPQSLFDMHDSTPAKIEAEQFCNVIYEKVFNHG